jgi:hypothetical protein
MDPICILEVIDFLMNVLVQYLGKRRNVFQSACCEAEEYSGSFVGEQESVSMLQAYNQSSVWLWLR